MRFYCILLKGQTKCRGILYQSLQTGNNILLVATLQTHLQNIFQGKLLGSYMLCLFHLISVMISLLISSLFFPVLCSITLQKGNTQYFSKKVLMHPMHGLKSSSFCVLKSCDFKSFLFVSEVSAFSYIEKGGHGAAFFLL